VCKSNACLLAFLRKFKGHQRTARRVLIAPGILQLLICNYLGDFTQVYIFFAFGALARKFEFKPYPWLKGIKYKVPFLHLVAVCPGYQPLVTEIHFQGDPKKSDPMYRAENAIAVEERNVNGKVFQTGVFDLVLERAAK